MKKQIILSTIESRIYKKTGKAIYNYGGLCYHVENVDGMPKVTYVDVPQNELEEMQVIVRI